jgi:hypothetical protein
MLTGSRPPLAGSGVRVVVGLPSMGSMTSMPRAGTAIGRTSTLPGGRATTTRLGHDPAKVGAAPPAGERFARSRVEG